MLGTIILWYRVSQWMTAIFICFGFVQAGHDFPAILSLAVGGSLLSYIYSAPPLKVSVCQSRQSFCLRKSLLTLFVKVINIFSAVDFYSLISVPVRKFFLMEQCPVCIFADSWSRVVGLGTTLWAPAISPFHGMCILRRTLRRNVCIDHKSWYHSGACIEALTLKQNWSRMFTWSKQWAVRVKVLVIQFAILIPRPKLNTTNEAKSNLGLLFVTGGLVSYCSELLLQISSC